ncbi:MAG: hypothetical protein DRP15_01585, partial [Candidatus Aenigmatarchaeota archaeon]
IFNTFFVDVILGFILVAMGIQKLSEDINNKVVRKNQDILGEALDFIVQWIEKAQGHIRHISVKNENRFHSWDVKRSEIEDKIERNYRDLVKKIIEIENRLNELAKRYEKTEEEPTITGLSKRQIIALNYVKKNRKITTGVYKDLVKVSEKTAYNDLIDMVRKGLLKKIGSGSKTHYVLAF